MTIAAALLIALAVPHAPPEAEGLEARPATWEMSAREGQPILRGASREDPGDRIIFMCNDDHRLIVTFFMLSDAPEIVVSDGSGTGRWVIDGAFQAEVDARPVMPMGRHVLSLSFVDPDLVRRLSAADAAGFAWNHRDGPPFAGFQISMSGAHSLLPAFARQCNAELYR